MLMKEQMRFRDPGLTKKIAAQIKELAPPYDVKFCHVCGTHEWTITHYGLRALLPETVKVIAGPGCPVCILACMHAVGKGFLPAIRMVLMKVLLVSHHV